MKISAVICLLFFASVAVAQVVELTPDNFDTVVDGSKNVFVEFFAPW
jgi:protein disulfide-isomerase A6